jgi:uncharacterized protein (UPF0212 family)
MLGAMESHMTLPSRHCPECGGEYVHTVLLCAECGVALVLAGEPLRVREDLPPSSELLKVRSATLSWARSFSELLAEAGIPHRVELEGEVMQAAGVPADAQQCSVFVRAEDREEAMRLDALHLRSQIPDVPDDYAPGSIDEGRCPACGEPADLAAPECASCGLAFRDAE